MVVAGDGLEVESMQILSGKAGPQARLQILLIMPTFAAVSKQLPSLNFSGNQELFFSFVRRPSGTASLRAIHQAQCAGRRALVKRQLPAIISLLCLLAERFQIPPFRHETTTMNSDSPPPSLARSLYERLGGVYAIAAVVDDFIDRVMDDPRLNANPKVDEAHHRVARELVSSTW